MMQRDHRRFTAFTLLLLLALVAALAAIFALSTNNTYTITASAGANGLISPSGAVTVVDGSDKAFGITPAAGYHVADVIVNGSSVGAVTSYTFTGVTSNHIIAASFAHDPDAIVIAASDSSLPENADSLCDGTNDQVQIQAAIDALEGKTGKVHLLDGTFNISSTILVHDDLTLQGEGDSTLIRLSNNSNCDVIGSYDGRYERKANVVISSLRIDGNKANQSDGCGIFRRGDNAIYEYLTIENCFVKGLTHTGGSTARVSNCIIRNCGGRGIFVSDTSYVEVSYNSVYNCGLLKPDEESRAICVWRGEHNVISYNYIEGGGLTRQLEARDTPAVEIIGNKLVDGLNLGIATHSQYARIINNTVLNAGNNAIDTCGENDNWIEGNYISRVTSSPLAAAAGIQNLGIALYSKRSTVINNYIELCGRSGIQLGPDCNDNQILNNVIKNCGQQETMGKAGIWLQIFQCDRPLAIKNTVIRGNVCFDDQSVKTQKHGVLLTTASVSTGYIDGVVIEDNDLRGNAVSGIGPYDPTKVLNVHIENNLT